MTLSRRSIPIALLLAAPCFLPSASGQQCPPPPPADGACEAIESYGEFEGKVEAAAAGTTIVFCDFAIDKPGGASSSRITADVHIVCQNFKKCIIDGGGTHIKISGSKARAIVQGFTFVNSTATAIRVLESADDSEHAICDCDFIGNKNRALKLEPGTKALVARNNFINNKSKENGAGIHNYGEVKVNQCTFKNNEANLGGGIMSTENGFLELLNSDFVGNIAAERGPAVYLDEGGNDRYSDGGSNRGEDNVALETGSGNCNGVFAENTRECSEFGPFGSRSPTQNPTAIPTASPTAAPTSSPTASPTSSPTVSAAPSTDPSALPSQMPTVSHAPSSVPSAFPSQMPTVSDAPSSSPSVSFMPTSQPSSTPTSKPSGAPTPQPTYEEWKSNPVPERIPKGYFNYDPNDKKYGPLAWEDLDDDYLEDLDEYTYWKQFGGELKKQLSRGGHKHNYCGDKRYDDDQSPIDVNIADLNTECYEYHELRTRPGRYPLSDPAVEMQILRNKLRIKWPGKDWAKNPKGDIPKGWGDFYPVIHVDIVFPSAHTMEGKEFPAEFQLTFMTHKGRGTAVFSILIDYDPQDVDNEHFQIAVDEWARRFEEDESTCRRKKRNLKNENLNMTFSYAEGRGHFQNLRGEQVNKRRLDSLKVWDPFHKSVFVSLYWYGYKGTTMEPPCYPIAEYRVLDTPMHLSRRQIYELQRILFTHVDEDCVPTSNHFNGRVTRPVQPAEGRDLHRCSCIDYYSDEKKRESGRPDCKADKTHPWYKKCPDWWGGECPSWYEGR